MLFAPGIEFVTDKFGSVVDADHVRQSSAVFELLQYPNDTQRRKRGIGLNPEYLPVKVVDYVQHPERTTIPEAVMHEVQAPDLIRRCWLEELLFKACRKSFLGSPPDIEPHGGVDPVYALVIPRPALRSRWWACQNPIAG